MADRTSRSRGVLVVVPCGRSKVWDREPGAGATLAREAYRGAPFKVNREYAESFVEPGDQWVILSAKYGFIPPDFLIPEPYEVTFKQKSSGPVGIETLRDQVQQQHLDQYRTVVGLGGKEYRNAIEAAFNGTAADLQFPFAGLPIGKAMQATKKGTRASCTRR